MSRIFAEVIDLTTSERRLLQQIATGQMSLNATTSLERHADIEYLRSCGMLALPPYQRFGRPGFYRLTDRGKAYLKQQEQNP